MRLPRPLHDDEAVQYFEGQTYTRSLLMLLDTLLL